MLTDRLGDGADPGHPIALAAQLVVIDHLGQAVDAGLERLLAVLVEEKLGIGQSRAHHPLIALNHGGGIVGRDVAHYQKLVR